MLETFDREHAGLKGEQLIAAEGTERVLKQLYRLGRRRSWSRCPSSASS
jgi:hypothetical protein